MSTAPKFLRWGLFYWWILACAVGGVVEALVPIAVLRVDIDVAVPVGFVLAIGAATIIAVPQWLVLRRHLKRAGWWVLATVAGVLVTLHGDECDPGSGCLHSRR